MFLMRSYLRSHRARLAATVGGALFIIGAGFVNSCDNRLLGLSQYIDPCGTFLANCQPGDFQVNAAGIGDYCVDPSCTVPGGCGNGQALGTITDLCP